MPSPVLMVACAFGDLGDEVVGDGADGHACGDGHAAFTRGAEAGVDHRVGGQVQIGVGQDHRVVLRAAEGLHPLACRGAGGVDVLGDRGGADEVTDLILGLVSSSSTAVLSPCSTLNTPSGRPASAHSRASHSEA